MEDYTRLHLKNQQETSAGGYAAELGPPTVIYKRPAGVRDGSCTEAGICRNIRKFNLAAPRQSLTVGVGVRTIPEFPAFWAT